MPDISHQRRSIVGGAVKTTTSTLIGDADVVIPVADGTTLPLASSGQFAVATINRGQTDEERIAYAPRVGNELHNCIRGFDGTTAKSHAAGADVEHGLAAVDADEANELVATVNTELTYTPVVTVTAGASFSLVGTPSFSIASYQVVGTRCHFTLLGVVGLTGSNPGGIVITLPVAAAGVGIGFSCDGFNQDLRCKTAGTPGATTNLIDIYTIGSGTFPTNGVGYPLSVNGSYPIA